MAPQPTTSHAPNHRTAIALAMLGVFVVSLLLAVFFVADAGSDPDVERFTFDSLSIDLPRDWREPEGGAAPDERVLYHRIDPSAPTRQLVVGRLPVPIAEPPSAASVRAARQVLGPLAQLDIPSDHPPRRFRAGPICGMTSVRIEPMQGRFAWHLLAVFTVSGREHWFAYLTETLRPGAINSRALDNQERLLQQWCSSAEPRSLRRADAADLEQAQLTADTAAVLLDQQRYHTFVERGQRPGQALLVVPADADPRFQVLRLRGTPDTGLHNPRLALSAPALLDRYYRYVHGSAAPASAMRQDPLDGWACFGLRLTQPLAPMQREIWHACSHRPTAVLVDALFESIASAGAGARVTELLGRLEPGSEPAAEREASPDGGEPSPALARALERGGAVVGHAKGMLGHTLEPGLVYELVEQAGRGVLARVIRSGPVAGDPQPLRRWAMGVPLVPGMNWQRSTWAAAEDGSRVSLQIQQFQAAGDHAQRIVEAHALALNEGQLSYTHQRAGAEPTQWQVTVPEGYMPPDILDAWHPDTLAMLDEEPALVWSSTKDFLPMAYWVRALRPGDGTTHLLVRPAMAVEPDRLIYDSQGRKLRYDGVDEQTGAAAGVRLSVHRLDRDTFLERVPRAREIESRLAPTPTP